MVQLAFGFFCEERYEVGKKGVQPCFVVIVKSSTCYHTGFDCCATPTEHSAIDSFYKASKCEMFVKIWRRDSSAVTDFSTVQLHAVLRPQIVFFIVLFSRSLMLAFCHCCSVSWHRRHRSNYAAVSVLSNNVGERVV